MFELRNSWHIKHPQFLLIHASIVNNNLHYQAAVVMLHGWEIQGLNLTPQQLLHLKILTTFFFPIPVAASHRQFHNCRPQSVPHLPDSSVTTSLPVNVKWPTYFGQWESYFTKGHKRNSTQIFHILWHIWMKFGTENLYTIPTTKVSFVKSSAIKVKGKAIPLQAWTGPKGSRR